MDRSWRERIEKEGTAAEEPGLTRWQKFIRGGYSFTALGRGFAEKLSIKQKKVEFLTINFYSGTKSKKLTKILLLVSYTKSPFFY